MSNIAPLQFLKSFRFLKIVLLLALVMLPSAVFAGEQLENHDSFCASCHTDPESEFVDRAHAGTAVDLASFHTGEAVHCIDCHSGEGVNGRVQAMTLGGHDLLKFVSGKFPQPAPLTHSINDENCTKCHSNISEARNFSNHFHRFLPEWQRRSNEAATCVDCHQSHTTDVTSQKAFLNEPHTTTVCKQCHSFVSGHNS